MPATVGGYHLFQYCLGAQPEEAIRFEEIETDLGGGYGVTSGFGVNTGIRRWKVQFPVIPGASAQASITYRGQTMTPADYLWELFCHSKRTGDPFVIQSPRNDQYYLVRFADRELSYARMLTKLFTTGVEFRQWRLADVTIFDPTLMGLSHWYDDTGLVDNGAGKLGGWADAMLNNGDLEENGIAVSNPTYVSSASSNGKPGISFDGTNDFCRSLNTITHSTVRQAFFALKFNDAAFSQYGGVLSAPDTTAVLVTSNSSTIMFDLAFSDYEYELNGNAYAANNQQAPMQQFGIVYCHIPDGVPLSRFQLGWDRDFVGRYAKMTLLGWGTAETLISDQDVAELVEHMTTYWAI